MTTSSRGYKHTKAWCIAVAHNRADGYLIIHPRVLGGVRHTVLPTSYPFLETSGVDISSMSASWEIQVYQYSRDTLFLKFCCTINLNMYDLGDKRH